MKEKRRALPGEVSKGLRGGDARSNIVEHSVEQLEKIITFRSMAYLLPKGLKQPISTGPAATGTSVPLDQ